jgi:Xaa-Pro aminopeptidase
MPLSPETISGRVGRVRTQMRAASLDTLIVTHVFNVRYLLGFTGTAGVLIILPAKSVLVVDFRYVTHARQLVGDLADVSVEQVQRTYEEAIVSVIKREGSLRAGVEAAYLPVSRFNAIAAGLASGAELPRDTADPATALVSTERIVERVRMIKDAGEIRTIREGTARLSAIARELPSFARAGATEAQVAEALDDAMRAAGFARPAFDTIVASGPNSALPHARPTDRVLGPGDAAVLDFGGIYDGYCTDLTRTVQLGAPPPALQELYDAVRLAQGAAIAAIAPGVRPGAVDAAARGVLEAHGLGEAFGHGTGHGFGLEVHEEPRIARLVAGLPDEPLEPGVVFTVEPGAYVPGVGGVRIEDDVLVTADGCEVLTQVPKLFHG